MDIVIINNKIIISEITEAQVLAILLEHDEVLSNLENNIKNDIVEEEMRELGYLHGRC